MSTREQDTALLKAIRAGDVGAFDTLYRRFAAGLLGYILQRVPNRAEAEEVLQETFIRLLRDKRFEPDRAGLGTYLYVIARNLSLNHVRDHGSKRHIDLEDVPGSVLEAREGGLDRPDDRLDLQQQLAGLQVALQTLPEIQREAFLLRHRQGRSYQEIAEIAGIPVGTAKSRVHLAVLALRSTLESTWDNVTPLVQARRRR